jgi:EAL and modified HD-GYP domain-containing signal transduction protein
VKTFVARQPILDARLHVYGYELLIRADPSEAPGGIDPSRATCSVISEGLLLIDAERFAAGRRAFVNVAREALLGGYITLLPKESTVVEILESVEPDDQVVRACRDLRDAGYLLALDDFVYEKRFEPLLDVAHFVKVDFLATDGPGRLEMVRRLAPRGIRLVAEKVETRGVFEDALQMGYQYFQGYFYNKPRIVGPRNELTGSKLHYMELLGETQRADLDLALLESVIKRDVTLTYKLLRFINSAFFGWRNEIRSIRHALVLMGEIGVRKWISFVTLAQMCDDKPEELMIQAVVRARLCEGLADRAGLPGKTQELFLMGIFSVLDAVLDGPLPEILKPLPIAAEIKDALLGDPNGLRKVFDCVLAYEGGRWSDLSKAAAGIGLDEAALPELYEQAVTWAHEALPAVTAAAA